MFWPFAIFSALSINLLIGFTTDLETKYFITIVIKMYKTNAIALIINKSLIGMLTSIVPDIFCSVYTVNADIPAIINIPTIKNIKTILF